MTYILAASTVALNTILLFGLFSWGFVPGNLVLSWSQAFGLSLAYYGFFEAGMIDVVKSAFIIQGAERNATQPGLIGGLVEFALPFIKLFTVLVLWVMYQLGA